jgi:hypothetical protein
MDKRHIAVGEDWAYAIEKAIARSTGLLLIMSESSVESPNVRDEIAYAMDQKVPVFPLKYEDCRIPLRLTTGNYIDYSEDNDAAVTQLIETLRQQLRGP